MAESVVIERRFRGPSDSAHGGYACGLLAERIEAPAAAVSLRLPPPLERPLEIRRGEGGGASMHDGDRPVAEAGPATPRLELPEPVSLAEAEIASAACPWADRHPFPECFGCGPERSQEEAVAIQMGPVAGREVFAAPWTPLAEFTAADGAVSPLFVWAALDCPTAAAAVLTDTSPSVLARLEARLLAPVGPEQTHTVLAWLLGHDGRKHRGAAAIFDPDGEPCAYAEGLWIELRDPAGMGVTA
jgi:hypothetical protein